jgi:hypothetical protein
MKMMAPHGLSSKKRAKAITSRPKPFNPHILIEVFAESFAKKKKLSVVRGQLSVVLFSFYN